MQVNFNNYFNIDSMSLIGDIGFMWSSLWFKKFS